MRLLRLKLNKGLNVWKTNRFGSEKIKNDMVRLNLVLEDMSYLMRVSLAEYYKQRMVRDVCRIINLSPDGSYFSVADNPFQ